MKQWQNDRALDATTECKNIVMSDTMAKHCNDRQNILERTTGRMLEGTKDGTLDRTLNKMIERYNTEC